MFEDAMNFEFAQEVLGDFFQSKRFQPQRSGRPQKSPRRNPIRKTDL